MKDDEPLWLGPAETLMRALEIARQAGAGSYLIFSEKTGHKARYEVDVSGSVKPMDEAESQNS